MRINARNCITNRHKPLCIMPLMRCKWDITLTGGVGDSGAGSSLFLFWTRILMVFFCICIFHPSREQQHHVDFDGDKWADMRSSRGEGHPNDNNLLFLPICVEVRLLKKLRPLRDYNTSN